MRFDEIMNKEGSDRSVTLTVQQQYMFFALGLLIQANPTLFLTDVDESNTIEVHDFMDTAVYAIMNESIPAMIGDNVRLTLWHKYSQVLTGNALQEVVDTLQIFNGYHRQNTPALGDSSYQDCYLPAGTYQIRLFGARFTNGGRLDIIAANETTLYQSTIVSAAEFYAAATTRNVTITGSFTITEPCDRLYFQANTKNGTSSSYAIPLTMIEIWKPIP